MTPPKLWSPGNPITADRMNSLIFEAVRSRRDIVLGNGSSFVNESVGNQTANMRRAMTKLVVAVEDFELQVKSTDLDGVLDDVPSGLVREVRLDRTSGLHGKETMTGNFRAWDPASSLVGTLCSSGSDSASLSASIAAEPAATKKACDVFYILYNEDSKRWEVLAVGSSQQLRHAVVCACLSQSQGWYVMELADALPSSPPDCDPDCGAYYGLPLSNSSSASDEVDECDLCDIGGFYDACSGPGGFDPGKPGSMGNGTYVYAYDKRAIPLRIGGSATIAWLGDVCQPPSDSASASASASSSASASDAGASQKLYTVLTGEYELVTIPHEVWECCPIEGVKRTECFTFIVEGAVCIGPKDPCDSASASASASG